MSVFEDMYYLMYIWIEKYLWFLDFSNLKSDQNTLTLLQRTVMTADKSRFSILSPTNTLF